MRMAREAAGLTQEQMAQKLRVKQQRYQPWESGKISKGKRHVVRPPYNKLIRFAEITGASILWLLGTEYKNIEPAEMGGRLIPFGSWVKGGKPHIPIELSQSEGPPVLTDCRDPKAFALRVLGDSMEPEFHEGDIIIISPDAEVNSGDFVVAIIDGETTFKQFKKYNNYIVLRPLNHSQEHEEIVIKGKRGTLFSIIGKVVEKKKRY